jgi:hypothetical protein
MSDGCPVFMGFSAESTAVQKKRHSVMQRPMVPDAADKFFMGGILFF